MDNSYCIAFENIHIYILDLKSDCFCSGVVHKLYNQFEALTVRANDYAWLFNHQGGQNTPKNDYIIWKQPHIYCIRATDGAKIQESAFHKDKALSIPNIVRHRLHVWHRHSLVRSQAIYFISVNFSFYILMSALPVWVWAECGYGAQTRDEMISMK